MALSVTQYRQLFVEKNQLIPSETFDKLAQNATETKQPLEQLLVEQAFITADQYLELLATYFAVPAAELHVNDLDVQSLSVVPEDFAKEHLVICFANEDSKFCIAVVDPSNEPLIALIKQAVGTNIRLFVATEVAIRRALVLYDGNFQMRMQKVVDEIAAETKLANAGSLTGETVAPLIDQLIETAVLMGGSDVHIENYQSELLLRLRVDGQLQALAVMPKSLGEVILRQVKVFSGLDIDQERIPQDGRFNVDVKGQSVGVRVSCLPSMWGEKIVMRVLPRENQLFNMANLGLLKNDLDMIYEYLDKPHGMVLVTGPTNSGKSTTLYAFLQHIALRRVGAVSISTIEDPIEYAMPGVTQVQVSEQMTFSAGLRSLLRQDPDILMVGEIRDKETAEFAIRGALVGRLMLSTLHTNDAPSTPIRLLDIGIDPYLVASTVTLIVAQRLARRLCDHCKQAYQPDETLLQKLNEKHDLERAAQMLAHMQVLTDPSMANLQFYKAVGCEKCNKTGYQGRIGIYELLDMNKAIKDAVYQRADSDMIREIAMKNGMKTLFEDGLAKVILGQTDLDEVFTVTYA